MKKYLYVLVMVGILAVPFRAHAGSTEDINALLEEYRNTPSQVTSAECQALKTYIANGHDPFYKDKYVNDVCGEKPNKDDYFGWEFDRQESTKEWFRVNRLYKTCVHTAEADYKDCIHAITGGN